MTAESDVVGQAIAAAHEATFKALTRYERVPFRRVLAQMLDCAPTPKALREFATKSPDRWAQAVSIMAGLAGFDRGVNPTINIYNVEGLSDAQLSARLRELERLSALPGEATRVAADSLGGAGVPSGVGIGAAASGGDAVPVGPETEKPPVPAEVAAAESPKGPDEPA